MANPRRREERTSRNGRKTLPDRSRGERRKREDRSYERQGDSIRRGDRRGRNDRDSRRDSGHRRSRRDSSEEVFCVYEDRRNSRSSGGPRRGGRGRGSAAQRSTASGSSATSGGSQATGDIGSGKASSDWGSVYPTCEGPIQGWGGMSSEERLDFLGEVVARDAAIRARSILR